MPSLKDLKALIKSHVKDAPKMNAGKEALLLFAEKKGLLKTDVIESLNAPIAKAKESLPEVLKAVKTPKSAPEQGSPLAPKVKDVKVAKAPKVADVKEVMPETKSRKASPFAQFMSANKGSGKSMGELSAMYRDSKLHA